MRNVCKSFLLIFTILSVLVVRSSTTALDSDTIAQRSEGDILLGGLARVHRRGLNDVCSELQEDGIGIVETINMIIDEINEDNSILPGVKLGARIIDTCDIDRHALRGVLEEFLPYFPGYGKRAFNNSLVGVVGGASSSVSIQVALLLQVFNIPQISYWSTHPDLSDKNRFKYFFRTVPSDLHQVNSMIALAKSLKWNYISVVYEDDFYGAKGATEIVRVAGLNGICVAVSAPVKRNPKPQDFDDIIKKLWRKPKAKAVIIFTKQNDAEGIMEAAQKHMQAYDHFIWVGSDGWTELIPMDTSDISYSSTLNGSIGVTPSVKEVPGIREYITNKTLAEAMQSTKNPWLPEFFSKKLSCNVPGSLTLKYENNCSLTDRIPFNSAPNYKRLQNVADAVRAFAFALDKIHKYACKGQSGYCGEMAKIENLNIKVFEELKNISFPGVHGVELSFDENQDGPNDYAIFNYKSNSSQINQRFNWKWVGSSTDMGITLNDSLILKSRSTSICSDQCDIGEEKIKSEQNQCCWLCQLCNEDEYVTNDTCTACPTGEFPASNKTTCLAAEIRIFTYSDTAGIITVVLACIVLLLTFSVICIYQKFKETPIVKASGQELSWIILLGIATTLVNPFVLLSPPSNVVCIVSHVILSLGPTLMYAGLLTKTIRVIIIFQSKKILSQQIKMLLQPAAVILIALLLVIIEVFIGVIWILLHTPGPESFHQSHDAHFYACDSLMSLHILVPLVYPFILIIICTVLATINRNVPTGFNETMHIVFSMYTTCVIWLAYVPIFATNQVNYPLKLTTTSICFTLSAATVLVCLFIPRCYVILFRPEENTHQSVMSQNVTRQGTIQASSASNMGQTHNSTSE